MRATLALIFFLSGASALIFESLWFRLAGLSLGNSVWSATLVLAAFMGGLALGNALVARMHHKVTEPVRLYALLEITIGVSGILVVLALPLLPDFLGPLFGRLPDAPVVLNATRVTIAFAVLVIPAIAMGATLPVLVKALSRRYDNFGANVGWLYGWNTLGAMIGAFSTALFLVPLLGILSSGLVAFMCNMVAAIIALRYRQDGESSPRRETVLSSRAGAVDGRTRRYIAIAFVSGALMLALEVVWFRFLLLTKDGTSLIFAVMLAVVLAGIAIGGLVAAHLFHRDDRAYRWLRLVTAMSASLVVLSYWGYDLFTEYRNRDDVTTLVFVGYATFLMFPVAFLSGIAFTMVNRAVKDQLGSSARTAGIATFYNTVGAMLGSLAGGFILLPVVGMESSFFLIAAMYCVLAFFVPAGEQTEEQTLVFRFGAVAVAIATLAVFPFGLMQTSYLADRMAALPNHSLISTREGLVETLRYFSRDVYGEPKYYRLITNGHSMSGTSTAAKRYMKLYVYLPIALKPDTENALLISYGVGSTAKALTDTRHLEQIDIVDISADILEMNSIVYPDEENPLRDKRVNVHIEDGRFFLNTTPNRYDLITSEPPPPKIAGVVNLYSEEYFRLIRERLNPGGYASYWLPVQQLEPTDMLAITKAFCNAFDDCSLWSGGGLEWMLLGSNDAGMQSNAVQMAAQWDDPTVYPELVALGFESVEQLGSLFMADAELLAEVCADVAPVRDNYPARISSRLVNDRGYVELYGRLMDESQRLERFRNSKFIGQRWPEELRRQSEPYFKYERLIKNHLTGNGYLRPSDTYYWEAVDDLLLNTSLTTLPLWLLGSDRATQEIIDGLLASSDYQSKFALDLARRYTANRDYRAALMYAHDHVTTGSDVTEWAYRFYLYLLAKNGMSDKAASIIAQLENSQDPESHRFLDWYASRLAESSAANFAASY
jgi:predicted membrane-bound spermidine synthase